MTEETLLPVDNEELMRMTTDIVASFLTHNSVPAESVPDMIKSVYATMKEISGEPSKPEPKAKPAVPVSRSVSDDYIVCLEDGKKLKMLKRYLRSLGLPLLDASADLVKECVRARAPPAPSSPTPPPPRPPSKHPLPTTP